LLPGVPAGLLFLLLVRPFSREANASEDEDGAAEEAVLSNMDGFNLLLFGDYMVGMVTNSIPTCTAGEVGIVGFQLYS
jgi:hypothetical protein